MHYLILIFALLAVAPFVPWLFYLLWAAFYVAVVYGVYRLYRLFKPSSTSTVHEFQEMENPLQVPVMEVELPTVANTQSADVSDDMSQADFLEAAYASQQKHPLASR